MKNLVIVESPSKSKTIEKYLGADFEVVSSKGHIRDLATKGKEGLGVDVDNDFAPTYSISKEKSAVVKELKAKAKKADFVYLATDPDREGEAISWHLASELGVDLDEENRVEFHEITKDAVLEAFKHPRKVDMDLVHSQETRRILDRIIGFKLSKLLNNKIKSKSAGRVQSVALKLIVEREKEIAAFVPQEYWTLDAKFKEDNIEFSASLAKVHGKKADIKTQEEAEAILSSCQGPFEITSIKKQVRKKEAKLPLITSTLQQEASTKLGFSAKRTMSIAQKLYEGIEHDGTTEGLITYMRTDSTRLSNQFIGQCRHMIEAQYGKEYLGFYKVKKDANAQDAHEAIRPTSVENTPEKMKQYLTQEQYKLYKLIYARAVASLMAPAKNNTISVVLSQNGADFTASGSQQVFDGYLKVLGEYETSKDTILPELEEHQLCTAKELKSNQHFTEPPLRYSEARLIKEMEEAGIGRPSTYATIIDTIQARGYVSLQKATETSKTKVFFATEQGTLTVEKLDEFFSSIINVKYTANMETELDEIAEGKLESVSALRSFYDEFVPLVDHAYQNMEKKELEKTGEKCPDCGNDLVYRQGRFGKFISCMGYPECKYTAKIVKEDKEAPEPTGKMCPDCGHELLKRKSRYGNYFLGCSNFPKCRHIENIDGEKPKFIRRKGAKKA
ncbi:MAG: type I DNA topoisomerase [Erysipelotrichaceae bacterium]|nr:type I DNA topoisomerase [Erysipelotrichaceae bacterium]